MVNATNLHDLDGNTTLTEALLHIGVSDLDTLSYSPSGSPIYYQTSFTVWKEAARLVMTQNAYLAEPLAVYHRRDGAFCSIGLVIDGIPSVRESEFENLGFARLELPVRWSPSALVPQSAS
eukprot:TRINITY_DN18804_c1_g1_i1.p3 TRINITY_DN18804_c1_g1~~TRINITY_DN18804_c1_g1_i1.p3  ORF type:complete len:128 (-),score=11.63 TRINITY_DN18804_c1_g1_i1:282-644(-)